MKQHGFLLSAFCHFLRDRSVKCNYWLENMKRKRNERYKNADKSQRDAIYRYTPADKNTKMPPPPNTFLFFVYTPTSKFQMQFYPPPRQFYIDGILPPGDTFFWNSPNIPTMASIMLCVSLNGTFSGHSNVSP